MKLSTKGRYSTKAMLDLALHFNEGPILIKDIARRRGISERYLVQLFIPLRVAGLVRSVRGARGGFTLAKSPPEIRLSEIIQAMEGSTAPVECVDQPWLCPQSGECVTWGVWVEMKKASDKVLESITLQHLVEQEREKRNSAGK